MSSLLRSLSAGAKALATGNISSLTGYDEKKAMQAYNREQARRAAGRGTGHNTRSGRETVDQYNERKAKELLGITDEPKKEKPTGHPMDRFAKGPFA